MSSRFRLSGEITDRQLFKDIVEAGVKGGGKLFYRQDDKGNVIDPFYFSGSQRAHYIGEVDSELASLIKAEGYKVTQLEWNEDTGILKIDQK